MQRVSLKAGLGIAPGSGISLVKTLVGRFDAEEIAQVLHVSYETINEICSHSLLKITPELTPEDGLILVRLLEKRLIQA